MSKNFVDAQKYFPKNIFQITDNAAFFLITTLVQLPIQSFLLFAFYEYFNKIQLSIQIAMLVLLPFEIILNISNIKSSLKEREMQFVMEFNKKYETLN